MGYFQRVLKDKGIFKKLEEMGIQDEDTVRLQDIEFEYFK
ncbi:Obg family GTPase CgtA [Streptococcus gordonii]